MVDPLPGEVAAVPEPGELFLLAQRLRLFAAVLAPMDVRFGAQDTGPFLPARDVAGQEGADVEANAVVDVGLPADGLLPDRLPTDEEVERRLAFEDGYERFCSSSAAARRSSAPPSPRFTPSRCRLIQSPR